MVRELPVGDAKKFRSKGRLEHDFLISFTIVSNEYSFISGQNSNVSNTRLIIKKALFKKSVDFADCDVYHVLVQLLII